MADLWRDVLPLALASMAIPVPLIVATLLARRSLITATAWVAGMTTVRVAQGLLFALVLSSAGGAAETSDGRSTAVSVVLLVVGVLLLTGAGRSLLGHQDPDAPPPRWMAMLDTLRPGRAFMFGAAYLGVSAKFWVFTLGALAAIEEADLGRVSAIVSFALFAGVAVAPQVLLVAFAAVAPGRAQPRLAGIAGWLERHNRTLTIVVGAGFGTWFVLKALAGFGVL